MNELMNIEDKPNKLQVNIEYAKILSQSTIIPASLRNNPGNICLVLNLAKHLNVSEMILFQNVCLIKDKLSFTSHFMWGYSVGQATCQKFLIESDENRAIAKITRKFKDGSTEEFVGEFSMEDAKKASLLSNSGWRTYPKQMLEARAKGFVCRNAYPELFSGLYSKEELSGINNTEVNFNNLDPKENTEPLISELARNIENYEEFVNFLLAEEIIDIKKANEFKVIIKENLPIKMIELKKTLVNYKEQLRLKTS